MHCKNVVKGTLQFKGRIQLQSHYLNFQITFEIALVYFYNKTGDDDLVAESWRDLDSNI